MAMRIIELLEIIDVEHHQTQQPLVTCGALELVLQTLHQVATRETAGELVRLGQDFQLFLVREHGLECRCPIQRPHRTLHYRRRYLERFFVERPLCPDLGAEPWRILRGAASASALVGVRHGGEELCAEGF